MKTRKQRKSVREITSRMITLAAANFKCSQIMMILALEQAGEENHDMVRAMAGLGDGCGFMKETCGIMTGAACVLSWYAGKGSEAEEGSASLAIMLQDLGDWFAKKIHGKYSSTRCQDILGPNSAPCAGKKVCGPLLLQTYLKTNKLLEQNSFIRTG